MKYGLLFAALLFLFSSYHAEAVGVDYVLVSPVVSPNGEMIAFMHGENSEYDVSIYSIPDDNIIATYDLNVQDADYAWSPNSDQLIISTIHLGIQASEIWLIDIANTTVEQLTDSDNALYYGDVTWGADDTIYAIEISYATLLSNIIALDVSSSSITTVTNDNKGLIMAYALAPDDKLYAIFFPDEQDDNAFNSFQLLEVSLTEGQSTVIQAPNTAMQIQVSPMGDQMVSLLYDLDVATDPNENFDIWILDMDTQEGVNNITETIDDEVINARWSPDGLHIGFFSNHRPNNVILYLHDIETSRTYPVTDTEFLTVLPQLSWAPDATALYFSGIFSTETQGIWRYDLETETFTEIISVEVFR